MNPMISAHPHLADLLRSTLGTGTGAKPSAAHGRPESATPDSSASYKADTDQTGQWCVWHRIGQHGWSITHACDNRSAAESFVADLNRGTAGARF